MITYRVKKDSLVGKCLFCLNCHPIDDQWRRSGRNSSRAGAWRQKLMKTQGRGATYWFGHHCFLSLHKTKDHLPWNGTTNNSLVSPPSIFNWDNPQSGLPPAWSDDEFYKLMYFFFQWLSLVLSIIRQLNDPLSVWQTNTSLLTYNILLFILKLSCYIII